jgi:hypothetical protein
VSLVGLAAQSAARGEARPKVLVAPNVPLRLLSTPMRKAQRTSSRQLLPRRGLDTTLRAQGCGGSIGASSTRLAIKLIGFAEISAAIVLVLPGNEGGRQICQRLARRSFPLPATRATTAVVAEVEAISNQAISNQVTSKQGSCWPAPHSNP